MFTLARLALWCSLISIALSQGLLAVNYITKQADFKGLTIGALAVRPNNELLVTISSPNAGLYQISPTHAYPPMKVASFPNVAARGIVELSPNKFYVVTSDSTLSKPKPGSSHVFEVDMTSFKSSNGKVNQPAKVHKVADLPRAGFPGQVTATSSKVVLVADERAGHVWRVDVSSGEVTPINEGTGTMGVLGAGVGINGIKVVQSCGRKYLYYTNTSKQSLYRVLIKPLGAVDGGPQSLLGDVAYNGLDLASSGIAYLTDAGGGLYKLGAAGDDQDGPPPSLVDDGALDTPTSVRFGRGTNKKILYIVTNAKGGAGVSSVDTSGILGSNSCL